MKKLILILFLTQITFAQNYYYWDNYSREAPIYLTRNETLTAAFVKPVFTILTGSPNFASESSAHYSTYIMYGNRWRCRQSDTLRAIEIYAVKSACTDAWIEGWRKDLYPDTTFTKVGSSNIYADLPEGTTATITLETPFYMAEGDFYALRIKTTGNAFQSGSKPGYEYMIYKDDSELDSAGVGFSYKDSIHIPVIGYMTSPEVVFLGNSITAGVPYHLTYLSSYWYAITYDSITFTIPYKTLNPYGLVYQNMGVPGSYATTCRTNIKSYVIDQNPPLCIVFVGVNDLQTGVVASEVIPHGYAIVDSLVNHNIKFVMCEIAPRNDRTNIIMACSDTINSAWQTYTVANGGRWFKTRNYVGEFNDSGYVGNLWHLRADCNSGDQLHWSWYGNYLFAQGLDSLLEGWFNNIP